MNRLARIISIISLILCAGQTPAAAQNDSAGDVEPDNYPVSVAYFGLYGFQPGLTVGTDWRMENPDALVVRPRWGFVTWPRDYWTVIAGVNAGWRLGKSRSSVTAGIDYFLERRVLEVAVDIGSGSLSPSRETRHHIVPTLGYRIDWNRRRPWHAQLSLGKRLTIGGDNAAVLVFALGTTFLFEQD